MLLFIPWRWFLFFSSFLVIKNLILIVLNLWSFFWTFKLLWSFWILHFISIIISSYCQLIRIIRTEITTKASSNSCKRRIFPGWSLLIFSKWFWCLTTLSNKLNIDLKADITFKMGGCLFKLFFDFKSFGICLVCILSYIKWNNS